MRAWATLCRFVLAIALVGVAFTAIAAEPGKGRPAKANPVQLREAAEKAEKSGDWEAAFNSYCHLFVLDRNAPELREKLNTTLRRVQQVRRHRDPGFQQFANGMQLTGSLDLFTEVVQRVPGVYVEREKATPQLLWNSAVEELDRALGNPTFRQAFLDNPAPHKVEQFRATLRRDWSKRTVTDHEKARESLRQLIAAARDAFPVRTPAALAVECACGACSGLDEYTVFLNPSHTGSQSSGVADLVAAGLYLGQTKDGIVVEGVVPNSWVALNWPQVRRGERIVRINGQSMEGAGLRGAAEALRHPAIDGNHQFELPPIGTGVPVIVSIPVNVPTVYGRKLVNSKIVNTNEIGYLRLGAFSSTTPRELDEAINALKVDGARAIVIDLRGNHGGSFLAGVEVARRLLPAGLIVTTQGQAANEVFTSNSGMSAHDIPVVVLIDAETASAAEVVAAALKDNNRATLVGMPSFGKGAVQYPLRLVSLDDDPTGKKPNKTGTVRVTIAKLIAPRSGPLNGIGVTPDFLEADADLQLQTAIEKALELLPNSMMMRQMPPLQPPMIP